MNEIAFEIYVRMVVESTVKGLTYPGTGDLIAYQAIAVEAAQLVMDSQEEFNGPSN